MVVIAFAPPWNSRSSIVMYFNGKVILKYVFPIFNIKLLLLSGIRQNMQALCSQEDNGDCNKDFLLRFLQKKKGLGRDSELMTL